MNIHYIQGEEEVILSIIVDDDSYRNRAIKGDNSLTLNFSLPYALQLPLGAYCEFQGEQYFLMNPENFTMKNTENYEYTLEMFSVAWNLRKYKLRNTVDKRLKFSLTEKPHKFIELLVDNLNEREEGWEIGNCIEGIEKVLSFSATNLADALNMIAEAYETEYEIIGKTIHLGKVEYNKNSPLSLEYGREKGLRPDVKRINVDDGLAIEMLCVQGGSQNIDRSVYVASELHLPKSQSIRFDGAKFEDEEGFDTSLARTYTADAEGYTLISDIENGSGYEDGLDLTSHYPQREEVITTVEVIDADNNFVDVICAAIPESLDYADCRIEGQRATIIFQSGNLAGKEFDLEQTDTKLTGYKHSERRFVIVPQEIDGVIMPNSTAYGGAFMPQIGDTFKVFNISLPTAYYVDNDTKTGAEWDMMREAVKYLSERLTSRYNYEGELDGIWAKRDWLNIGGKIKLGGYVKFTHQEYEPNGVLIRITEVKDYINNPHSPEITLSNAPVGSGGGIRSDLNKIPSNEVKADEQHKQSISFTRRSFSQAKDSQKLIEEGLLEKFSKSINPITINTMSLLVGDESLQFRFIASETDYTVIDHQISFDNETKVLTANAGTIQHLTLGVKSISSTHANDQYKKWNITAFNSPYLGDNQNQGYYLYAKCEIESTVAEFVLSENPLPIDSENGYYHLWVGVLGTELENERAFTALYGFTEISPGRITADRIISADGQNYLDFLANTFRVGNQDTSIDYNSQGDGIIRLKGTIVQSGSGEESPISTYRGDYDADNTYYKGDEVSFEVGGTTSTYIYIADQPSSTPPTDLEKWKVKAKGSKGTSVSLMFRGQFSSTKNYFNNDKVRDVVKYGATYYMFSGLNNTSGAWDADNWENFGATFESVATDTLLADGASIGDWSIDDGKIVSTLSNGNKITLDAGSGEITLETNGKGDFSFSNSAKEIKLSLLTGSLEVRDSEGHVSYLNSSGVFSNFADTTPITASTGVSQYFRSALVGLGRASVSKYEFNPIIGFVTGVFGSAENSSAGGVPAFGGVFEYLKAQGFVGETVYITNNTDDYYKLERNITTIIALNSERRWVYLPSNPEDGQILLLVNVGGADIIVDTNDGTKLYDDTSENSNIDIDGRQFAILVFCKNTRYSAATNGMWTFSHK